MVFGEIGVVEGGIVDGINIVDLEGVDAWVVVVKSGRP